MSIKKVSISLFSLVLLHGNLCAAPFQQLRQRISNFASQIPNPFRKEPTIPQYVPVGTSPKAQSFLGAKEAHDEPQIKISQPVRSYVAPQHIEETSAARTLSGQRKAAGWGVNVGATKEEISGRLISNPSLVSTPATTKDWRQRLPEGMQTPQPPAPAVAGQKMPAPTLNTQNPSSVRSVHDISGYLIMPPATSSLPIGKGKPAAKPESPTSSQSSTKFPTPSVITGQKMPAPTLNTQNPSSERSVHDREGYLIMPPSPQVKEKPAQQTTSPLKGTMHGDDMYDIMNK